MTGLLDWDRATSAERRAVLSRPRARADEQLLQRVRSIVLDVQGRGWAAVEHYSKWIDGAVPEELAIKPLAEEARRTAHPEFLEALHLAAKNIELFHTLSKPADLTVETLPGLIVSKRWRPIERVGIYVPGGSAQLFSTLLMLALPARAAGVTRLTVVTPPRAAGLDPSLALAAELCGIEKIWTVGGAHAVAALAFGAGNIEPVDLICGPGNAWVTAAKSLVACLPEGPRIDVPAGPSELMIIADESADPNVVAADLLSQAEHDTAAQVILVTYSSRLAARVAVAVELQLADLPRSDIARQSLATAKQILVKDAEQAADVANAYAPEHLALSVAEPEALSKTIRNAGSIFAGERAAETFGDYLAGSSHVLPTDGAARAWSGVSTQTFMKAMTVQTVSKDALAQIAKQAATLARAEGLEGHARAAEARSAEAK